MRALVTICSKKKRADKEFLPAKYRYNSKRIEMVIAEAEKFGLPAFILSGKYGLLSPDQRIEWYDQLLQPDSTEPIRKLVAEQLNQHKISEVVFYAKQTKEPGWQAYYDMLTQACKVSNIPIIIKLLA